MTDEPKSRGARTVRLLGIDPGLRNTGWGIVEATGNAMSYVGAGTICTDQSLSLAAKLVQICEGLELVISSLYPAEAAVENTFVNKDAAATLKLGQARGIALLVPARAGLMVAEYAPNMVKKAVTGVGHGDKRQVQMMVKTLLPRAVFDTEHAADALAVAICHAHMRNVASLQDRIVG